jgi:hypothetical protein
MPTRLPFSFFLTSVLLGTALLGCGLDASFEVMPLAVDVQPNGVANIGITVRCAGSDCADTDRWCARVTFYEGACQQLGRPLSIQPVLVDEVCKSLETFESFESGDYDWQLVSRSIPIRKGCVRVSVDGESSLLASQKSF